MNGGRRKRTFMEYSLWARNWAESITSLNPHNPRRKILLSPCCRWESCRSFHRERRADHEQNEFFLDPASLAPTLQRQCSLGSSASLEVILRITQEVLAFLHVWDAGLMKTGWIFYHDKPWHHLLLPSSLLNFPFLTPVCFDDHHI